MPGGSGLMPAIQSCLVQLSRKLIQPSFRPFRAVCDAFVHKSAARVRPSPETLLRLAQARPEWLRAAVQPRWAAVRVWVHARCETCLTRVQACWSWGGRFAGMAGRGQRPCQTEEKSLSGEQLAAPPRLLLGPLTPVC